MRAMRTRRRHETTIRAGKEEDKEEEKEDDKEEEKEKGYAEEGGGGRVLVAGSWSSGVSVLRDSIMATHLILLLPIILLHFKACVNGAVVEYYGKPLGPLSSFHHAVSGNVFAVDARTIHIRDFNYDGEGPAAYFYAGNSKAPGSSGFRIADERGQLNPLKKYRKRHVTITLPEGKTLHHIKWLSIWCEEFAVNFGDVKIPKNLDVPKPQKLAGLSGVHSVSSDPIVVVDAQTLLVPSFSYDGEAPDAKFWVGRGNKPSPAGVRVPDENGKEVPLRRYSRKTLVLTLPGDLTVFDIGHFGVWCEAFTVDFGHIQIGRSLNVPPSLKMLGVSPQSKLNCEVLDDELAFEVRWAVAGDSIVIQLVAKLEDGEYISFGPSGEEGRNVMVGADVVVAWVDHATLNGYAVDYYLDAKSQCAGQRGSCPDVNIESNTESVRLLNAALVNGYSIVTYQRPLKAHDALDKPIYTNRSQAVIWAVGPLNSKQEVSYHSITSKATVFLDFGRQPSWNCPIPEQDAALAMTGHRETIKQQPDTSSSIVQKEEVALPKSRPPPPPAPVNRSKDAWEIPAIQCNEPDDGIFYAQMGPTGGKRGYSAITGHVGWGISYFINGLLIPEIYVVRGMQYTFITEGGMDPDIPAKYHPFYITDDPVGGYEHKTPEEKAKVRIFAGVEKNSRGEVVPTGTGRLCNWTPDPEADPDSFASFGAYQRVLTLVCDYGEPGLIQWTPDKNTPDTVYYQCFSHRYLGWKIHVLDSCDLPSGAASEPVAVKVPPQGSLEYADELQSRPSIRVATRVLPHPQIIKQDYHKTLAESPANFKDGINGYESGFKIPFKPDPSKNGGYEIAIPNEQYFKNSGAKNNSPYSVNEDVQEGSTLRNFENTATTLKQNNVTYLSTSSYLPTVTQPTIHPQVGRRPLPQVMTIIRPHRPIPPIMLMAQQGASMHRPLLVANNAPQLRPIIMKKPVLRVPSRPAAPIPNRPLPQSTVLIPASQRPHQQQQVTKSVSVSYSTGKLKKPIPLQSDSTKLKSETKKRNPSEQVFSSMPLSSGFNPGAVVLESGFKPIIHNFTNEHDRVGTSDDGEEEEGEEMVGAINLDPVDEGQNGGAEEVNKDEFFEPIFVPSPLDSLQKPTKKQGGDELSPTKKKLMASNKPVRQSIVVIRRRPMYAETPKFRSQSPDQVEDELAMAAEQMDTYYLPPSGPIYGVSTSGHISVPAKRESNGATIVTYDGKPVANGEVLSPSSLSSRSFSKKPKGSEDLVRSTPQFGVFRGDIPPPVPENIRPESIPQLQSRNVGAPSRAVNLDLQPTQGRTQLTPIQLEPVDASELYTDASNKQETIAAIDDQKEESETKYKKDKQKKLPEDGESTKKIAKRERRSAHEGHSHDNDDHDHHNHQHTDDKKMMKSAASYFNYGIPLLLVSFVVCCVV
ncbi:protein Skeletor, isoforms B/C isoform X3 [Nilaparvata lugens]|uniref:protein Skeletor, isoforms B/C isoform X3 n=1 Tax=Nilaparvata lugens TaxID=108931 RepID=UPI00193EC059|nr:protein Skeletor, isoforms B/C isoform X3 [Nilaparvata lugens]